MPQPFVFAGSEFTVNVTTSGVQNNPRISAMDGGGYVVMWNSGTVGIRNVKAQVYNAAGMPISGELTLAGGDDQIARDILGTPDGGFVAVWSHGGQIKAQRYDGGGNAVGAQILVAAPTGLFGTFQNVALYAEAGGGFTVVWETNARGIHLRSYEADGDPIGTVFDRLFTTSDDVPSDHLFVRLAGGGFLLSHEGLDLFHTMPEDPGYGASPRVLEIYNAAGTLVSTSPFPVESAVPAALDGGGFVVFFRDLSDGSTHLAAQKYDDNGVAVGGEIGIHASLTGGLTPLDVAALPGGGFVVAFESKAPGGGIEVQIFDAGGAPLGARFLVNQVVAGGQEDPQLIVRDNGDIVVVWEEGTPTDVKARVLTPATVPLPVTDGTGTGETLNGGAGSEEINGLGGDDFVYGNDGDDTVSGGNGSDWVVGGAGYDELHGGDGDDFIFADYFDQVYEAAGQGYDNVIARTDYALSGGAHVEVLSTDNHAGTDPIRLRGNEFGQVVIGNAGNNHIHGGGGVDWLDGFGGSDTYYTDGDDIIIEASSNPGDVDVVNCTNSYRLTAGSYVEAMFGGGQTSHTTIDLTGNERNQTLTGNNGQNGLDGGGGNDILKGLYGDDFYWADAGTSIEELSNQGYDNVFARVSYTLGAGVHIEVLSTASHGGTAAIDLTGNELVQVVIGNAGANILDGKLGSDRLAGLGGADSYKFTTVLGNNNIDTIDGFDGDDTILLDNAIFTGLADGALPAGAFVIGTAAADADDRIVYDSATGRLYFDADGVGAGNMLHFATLEGAPALGAADFTVI